MLEALHVVEEETSGLAAAISTSLRRVVYVCGDEIIREAAPSDALYFIAAGKVNVIKQAAAGQPGSGNGHHELAPLTSLGAGTLFGEMSLLSATPWANPTLTLSAQPPAHTTPTPTPNPSPNPNPNLLTR